MRLSVMGRTLPDLFQQAAFQLMAQLLPTEDIGEALREKIVVEASDLNGLLSAWINTLLDMARVQHMIFCKHEFSELTEAPARLCAESIGELIDPLRHVPKQSLESLKCLKAELSREKEDWKATIELGG